MRLCENCLHRHWRAKIDKKTGLQVKHKNGNLVYICVKCGQAQEEDGALIPVSLRVQANILYIDTENSTSIYENYGAKVQSKHLSIDNLVSEWYMLGWCASYMGDEKVFSGFVTGEQARRRDDGAIAEKLHGLMSAAEIIAGHNVVGFDLKRCNTLFKKHKLPAIVGKKTIDTLKLARSCLALESNTLDYVATWLGFDGKHDITRDDWRAATKGDKPTLHKIEDYCKNDVLIGKKVLTDFLPLANKKYNFGAIKKDVNDGDYDS